MTRTTLADINVGGSCLVTEIYTEEPELRSRLYALGVIPGSLVKVLRLAPLGDPMQVRIRGSYLSIRKSEASTIAVEIQ